MPIKALTLDQINVNTGKPKRAAPVQHEARDNRELMRRLREPKTLIAVPELIFLTHIPNGGSRPRKFDPRTNQFVAFEGYLMKLAGVKADFPDYIWAVPKVGDDGVRYCGLAMETKSKQARGRVRPGQKLWLKALAAAGWRVCAPTTVDEAYACVMEYSAQLYAHDFDWRAFRDIARELIAHYDQDKSDKVAAKARKFARAW